MNDVGKNLEDVRLETLKQAISEHVFVKKGGGPIVTKTGAPADWLFDFRAILLQSTYLDLVADLFWERYADRYPFQVGGQEVAAIPLVTAIVMKGAERDTPVNGFFLRKSRKKDGLMKTIEGQLNDKPVILVDDLINSGQTFDRQRIVLGEAGATVTDIFALLRFRPMERYSALAARDIDIQTLFSLEDFDMPLESTAPAQQTPLFDVLWKFQSGEPSYHWVVPKSAPVLDETKVYFGSDHGVFWALHQENGSVAWKYQVGLHPKGKGIFSSPVLFNDTVYFGAYDGNVYALDTMTGKKQWAFMEADWIGSSPAVAPKLNLLFVGLEFGLFKKRGGIAALDLTTGKKKWEYIMPEFTHSSPLFIPEERAVIIGSNDGVAYCFDAKTGALRWQFQTAGDIKESFAYSKAAGAVTFGSMNGSLYVLDAKTGVLRFSFKTGAGIYSTPAIVEKSIFVASLDKHLYKVSLKTGALEWSRALGARIFAAPLIIEDFCYIGSNTGRFHKINIETGTLEGFIQVSERITNQAAYHKRTDTFFLPTVANEIYTLRERRA